MEKTVARSQRNAVTNQVQNLRRDFCPPIDEPTFYAICFDYDLRNQEALGACRKDLDVIRVAAVEADTTAFDASGTGGFAARDPETSGDSNSSHNGAASASQEIESITTGLSDLAWDDASLEGQSLDDAGVDAKILWLNAMFPDIVKTTIRYRLQKCNENLTRTIDELLNLSFIEQNEPEGKSGIPRGIDGFTQFDDHSRGRKAKGKVRRQTRRNESTRSNSTTSPHIDALNEPKNVWASMTDDVDFICARTNLDAKFVRSTYNAQKKLLGRTVSSIASEKGVALESTGRLSLLHQVQFAELRSDFPTIPDLQLHGLLAMSGNIISTGHELAAAMVAVPELTSNGIPQITARYAPIDLGSQDDSGTSPSLPSRSQLSHSVAKSLAISKAAAGDTAFSQAANAYKRGKSDHLMGGAAAHYAAVGHENVRVAKELSAQAAESLVMSHSNSKMLDLHGVSVADAVRIAKEQVARWWDDLGDTKYAAGGGGPAREGYRVVTGVGRHSRDGAPKIGPAVSRMLVREGWKLTVGQGEILITGKARRS